MHSLLSPLPLDDFDPGPIRRLLGLPLRRLEADLTSFTSLTYIHSQIDTDVTNMLVKADPILVYEYRAQL
jgi:hypothetical protein